MEDGLIPEANARLVSLLERHRSEFPQLGEELDRHRMLSTALAEQHRRSAEALQAWRAAIAHRWRCEVAAQRVLMEVHRRLCTYYNNDPDSCHIFAPDTANRACTPKDLLLDLRRLAAALEMLGLSASIPPSLRDRLQTAIVDLAAAIDQTERYEYERRQILAAKRMTSQMVAQAYARSLRLLSQCIGDGAVQEVVEMAS